VTVLAGAVLFTACSGSEAAPAATTVTTTVTTTLSTTVDTSAPVTTSTTADSTSEPAGLGTVRVLGLWSGPEFDSFEAVMTAWQDDTGGTIDWTGTRDLPRELADAIAAGDAPDIAVLPNPGLLQQLAADGRLVPLSTVLDADQLDADYSAAWLDLGSHDGEHYGIPYKVTDKSTVWYSPPAFAAAGYTVPTTWDEMIALADAMVADGRTPFSIVAPKVPGGGGWALTDVVSNLVLTSCGPETYDGWVAASVPWTDPCVAGAFDRFVALTHTDGYVAGGSDGILGSSDADGVLPLFTDPPGAYLYPMASFAQAFIAGNSPDLAPGTDYDTMAFPPVDPAHAGAITVGADIVVMLHDSPAARSFMAYLAGADAQQVWIDRGGFTSVNRSVPLDAYADPVARATAEQLGAATTVRFSAGDLMPSGVQQAWWAAMRELVSDPTTLAGLLDELTATAAQGS
jgi:alpha-glucoside transport system substrate-binding protein